MSIYDKCTVAVRQALNKTEHGRKLAASWTDFKIKEELKDPCFFGVKAAITDKDRAVKHFEKIAEFRK